MNFECVHSWDLNPYPTRLALDYQTIILIFPFIKAHPQCQSNYFKSKGFLASHPRLFSSRSMHLKGLIRSTCDHRSSRSLTAPYIIIIPYLVDFVNIFLIFFKLLREFFKKYFTFLIIGLLLFNYLTLLFCTRCRYSRLSLLTLL
jgi:hypothetical protein